MITLTDLFAGAGGSSTGATQVPGMQVRMAANHWKLVTDIHAANHPNTDHAVVDLHQERPSFFPKTDMLWASPECTKWSQANGAKLPAIEEGLFEDPLSDDAKNRSRLLMFDVLRFIEYHRYRLVIVENVVDIATQAKYRTAWTVWRQELRALGYQFRVVSLNSMHAQAFGAPAPQSRDRIYIVAWPEGHRAPDLDRILRPRAYCPRCDVVAESVQSFKRGREVGRYRQAYVYCCSACGGIVEPGWLPAAAAIDWSIPAERIGDRLKPKTRARIATGIARYWGPLATTAAGGIHDALIHRHNGGGAEMTTLAAEYLRTLTTGGNVSLLQQPGKRRITTADLRAAEEMVPEVLFRMFRPHEVAAGMAFPADYKWQPVDRLKPVSNRDLVKAAGNAVTPPAARDLIAAAVESLGVAA